MEKNMITSKEYKCSKCQHEFECETNHYGEIYHTPCCGLGITATFIGTVPEGVTIPQPWSKVALSDILRAVKVA